MYITQKTSTKIVEYMHSIVLVKTAIHKVQSILPVYA